VILDTSILIATIAASELLHGGDRARDAARRAPGFLIHPRTKMRQAMVAPLYPPGKRRRFQLN
jgi:hypothetical protein